METDIKRIRPTWNVLAKVVDLRRDLISMSTSITVEQPGDGALERCGLFTPKIWCGVGGLLETARNRNPSLQEARDAIS